MAKTVAPPKPAADLVKVQQDGFKMLTPLERDVNELTITDQDDYDGADILLGDIGRVRKSWAAKIAPILDPLKEALTAAKRAMDGAKKLDRDIDGPLETLEERVKTKMRLFKIAEARRISEEKLAEEQEKANAQHRLLLAQQAQEKARTPNAKAQAALKVRQAQEQIEAPSEVEEGPKSGDNSTARTVKAWRFTGSEAKEMPTPTQMADILQNICEGKLPAHLVTFNMAEVNKQFVRDATVVEGWPGFELYDDVVIARR